MGIGIAVDREGNAYVTGATTSPNFPGTSASAIQSANAGGFDADLVVADLSRLNANVFYELAIRHATRRPAVHLVSADGTIPFDVNQIRIIKFNLADPDSIEDAQRRLSEQVAAIDKGENVTTPSAVCTNHALARKWRYSGPTIA